MHEHFRGKYEVELKFRIQDITAFRENLFSHHPESFVFENKEYDIYYDATDKSLTRQNISMLLRRMAPSGIKLWIVKGPSARRCEVVNVESFDMTDSMLKTLGFQPIFEVNKTRSIYFLDRFHITMDYIESLGHFVEISCMTEDETELDILGESCTDCALRLGLDMDNIETRSYRQLLGY
ncbi:class IV adenylate cyclase [Dickeya undicola]|uniref:Class IV adenylate cyclase n=1 Tax=Dickeya undicola TaxID=1577887 RepID=A0A3N0FSD8_9GAMM|nr:class IV adenylate cyclase [Dickeya undicola]RNM02992.1 class IV adenylate cyclase [Dickeya undicola]RNM24571.1 class IV adenylate cyclase [Dickeya undicola]